MQKRERRLRRSSAWKETSLSSQSPSRSPRLRPSTGLDFESTRTRRCCRPAWNQVLGHRNGRRRHRTVDRAEKKENENMKTLQCVMKETSCTADSKPDQPAQPRCVRDAHTENGQTDQLARLRDETGTTGTKAVSVGTGPPGLESRESENK